jgi:hypothetical protein
MLPSMSLPQEIIASAAELHAGEAAHLLGSREKITIAGSLFGDGWTLPSIFKQAVDKDMRTVVAIKTPRQA